MSGWFWVLFWWVIFGGAHVVLSSIRVRAPIIARIGERGFRGVYSVVALVAFIFLVRAYWGDKQSGPELWAWGEIAIVKLLVLLLSVAACILLVLAFMQPSPVALPNAAGKAYGVTRITRHPLFAALGLLGFAHVVGNGHLSAVFFFGGFVVFTFIGAAHQDARKRVTAADRLGEFYGETSVLPFGAILGGRNRLVSDEIPWRGVVIGVVVALVLLVLHPLLFAS